jgi:hypothetical protein
MKTRLPRVVLRAVFVVGALGAAYLVGLSQRIVQHEAAAADAAAKKQAEEARAEANYKPPPKLSRDAVWQKILNGLQKGDGASVIWNAIDDGSVDDADMPFLVEQLAKLSPSSQRDELIVDFFRGGLVSSDPASAISLVGLIAAARTRDQITGQIFSSLAKKDPDLARQELAKLPPGPQAQADYESFYHALADDAKSAPVVADEAFNLPAGPERTAALDGVARGWAYHDVHAMLDWAGGLPLTDSGVLKQALLDVGAGGLFDIPQPQLAAQYLDKLGDAAARNEVIEHLAGIMVVASRSGDQLQTISFGSFSGPDQGPTDQYIGDQTTSLDRASTALDWLNQVATGATYDQAAQNIFASLSEYDDDPQMVANLLDKVSAPDVRDTLLANVAGQWGQDDPQAALTWAQALPATEAAARTAALNSIVESWGEDDPKAALTWVETQPATMFKDALNTIVGNWALDDPAAVAAFLQNFPDPSLFSQSAEDIAINLAEAQPAAALAFAQSLPASEEKNKALGTVLSTIAQSNFPTAWQDALNLPADSSRDAAMSSLISDETDRDPTKAAGLIGQIADANTQIEATTKLAQTWAQNDPQAATTWVNGLPPGAQRDAATAQLVSAQMSADPVAALALANSITDPQAQAAQVQAVQLASQINQLPPGGARDTAITQLLPIQMQTDPDSALTWASTISNPQVRSDQLQAAFVTYISTDPNGDDFALSLGGIYSVESREFDQLTDSEKAAVFKKIDAARAASGKPPLPASPFDP